MVWARYLCFFLYLYVCSFTSSCHRADLPCFQLLAQLYRDNLHSHMPAKSTSSDGDYICGGHMLIADTIVNLLYNYQARMVEC